MNWPLRLFAATISPPPAYTFLPFPFCTPGSTPGWLENEITKKLKIVTGLKEGDEVHQAFFTDLEVLDRAYPDIKIEYVQLRGTFGPEIINKLSKEWEIPINFMFISSPSDRFTHRVSDLGGFIYSSSNIIRPNLSYRPATGGCAFRWPGR